MDRKILTIASFSGALVVGFGAFGAHGLEDLLLKNGRLDTYETAVRYHMFHTLFLLFLSYGNLNRRRIIAGLITSGIIIFSGSLYILSITNISKLGAITPIGGVFFIISWLWLAWEGIKKSR